MVRALARQPSPRGYSYRLQVQYGVGFRVGLPSFFVFF